MDDYWFKRYGKLGNAPVNWKGWALFVFIITLLVQVSNHVHNIVYVFIGAALIALMGYFLMRLKTNPSEVYSKETDNLWKTQPWGGLIGLVGGLAIFIAVLSLQPATTQQTLQDTNDSDVSQEIEIGSQPQEQTSVVSDTETTSKNTNVSTPATQTETAYVSQQYGFKVTPPKNWIVDESGEAGTVVFFLNETIDNEAGYIWQGSINVGVFGGNSGFSIDDIISSYKLQTQQWVANFTVVEEKKIKIGGYDAVIVSGTFIREGHNFRDYRLFVLKGDNLYNVSGVVLNSTWTRDKDAVIGSVMSFAFQ